jgi:hypothetical protein
MQLLQLMQFWKVESFAVSLTNKFIGSDVKIDQDSIDGYEGLGFDISTFNEDGSGDVYVNPQMDTNSVWERGLPKWEFLTFLYGDHHMETAIPIWKTLPYGYFFLNSKMGMNSVWEWVSD